MILELVMLVVASFSAGSLFNSYGHDEIAQKWKLFVLALIVLGCAVLMNGIVMRAENEKIKARLDQVKEIKRAMEGK